MPFQGAEQIEDGNRRDRGIRDGTHVALRHAAAGNQTEKTTVLLNNREGGNAVIILVEHLPGIGNGNAGADGGRRVKIDIRHLGTDGAEMNRRLKAETVQQEGGFRIQMAVARRNVVTEAQSVLEGGVGHGGND